MVDRDYWRHERIAFLALANLKGVGFHTLYKLSKSGKSFNEALRNPSSAGLDRYIGDGSYDQSHGRILWEEGLRQARELANQNIVLIFKNEVDFPAKLYDIPDSPEWIFVQGNILNLYKPAVSVVGTRKPSEDGLFLTKFVVAAVAHHKCATVSGLALGIDQAAHVESIRYGIPTVAVLGTGICQNYPRGSEQLRSEILASNGTVISEYLPNQSYSAENFVRRNRLQAALGDILFPSEWSIKSGTAHTVKFAHKYNRKIINLYLPKTAENKPELKFSNDSYGAISLEIPTDAQLMMALISVTFEENYPALPDPLELDPPPAIQEDGGHVVSHQKEEITGVGLDETPDGPQLPLL